MFWDSHVLIVTDTVHANESLTLDLEKHKTQTINFVSDLSCIVGVRNNQRNCLRCILHCRGQKQSILFQIYLVDQKQSILSQIYLVEVRNSQFCLRFILHCGGQKQSLFSPQIYRVNYRVEVRNNQLCLRFLFHCGGQKR